MRNMTPIRRKCFPVFSLMHFIVRLIPWAWACDLRIYSQAPNEASFYGELTSSEAQTDEFLPVNDNDLVYLTREEAKQIIAQFMRIPRSYNRLVFWTGIPREWVQQWADEHGMLTLTTAMGPLMDRKDPRCLKTYKEPEEWSKYIKGASRIFARYACGRGIVRVLTLPPTWVEFIRPESTYRNIEEPILKGACGSCCAIQINTVHLLTTLEVLEYQTWPENCIPESFRFMGAGSFGFRLPSWTRRAVKAAATSLGRNAVAFRAIQTPKPAEADVTSRNSVRKISGSQPAKKSKNGKQPESDAKARGSLKPQSKTQPQTQQSSCVKQLPQIQQLQNKKQKLQAQQTATKTQQSKNQRPRLENQQPKIQQQQTKESHSKKQQQQRGQQSRCEKQKPQDRLLQSEEPRPQNRQPHSKTQQLQIDKRSNQNEQPKSSRISLAKFET